MKKLTTIIAAMAAVLLTGACNKAEVEHEGSAVTLDYTVSVTEAATKAIGDGTTVDKMVYAIFNEGGAQVGKTNIVNKTGNSFSFSPALYYGQTYTIALFAYKDGAYNVDYITAITRIKNGEAADAFAHKETVKITQDGMSINGGTPEATSIRSVQLTRPMAQLAVGTENLDDLTNSGVTKVEVTVDGYDVASYNCKERTCKKDNGAALTYEMLVSELTSNTFTVNSTDYNYVSVNYLFPTAVKTVVITLKKKDGTVVRTITLDNVPFEANKKTQIYGNLVKGDITFNVSINKDFSTEVTEKPIQQ